MRRAALLLVCFTGGLWAQTTQFFTVEPTSLSFGNVPVGSSMPLTLTVTQPRNVDFTVSYTVSSNNTPTFSPTPTSFQLFGGQSRDITVTFTPPTTGTFSADITVVGTAGQSQRAVIPATGTGQVAPCAFPSAGTSLDFGNVAVGNPSTLDAIIQNTGSGTCQISSAVSGPTNASFTPNPNTFTLQPAGQQGAGRTVAITATPAAIGPFQGTVTFTATPVGGGANPVTFTISITGNGVGSIQVSPTAVNFGDVAVGTSPTATIMVSNQSRALLTVNVTAGAAFSAAPLSFDLAGGASRAVTITFTPPNAGTFNGSATFTPSSGAAQTVGLTGNGVSATITVTPASVDFGDVVVGASATQTLTVSNPAKTAAAVTVATAAPFTVSPASFTVAPGGSLSVTVGFSPTATGAARGAATFTAPGGNVTVALAGRGVTATLSVTPTTLDFGDVAVGSSANRTVTVSNGGTASTDVSASTAAPFTVSPAAFTLAAGASRAVTVTAAPTAAGTLQGTARFTAAGITATVGLTGRGTAANLSVTPAALDFGDVVLASSATRSFTVSNSGNVSADVTGSISGGGPFTLSVPSFSVGAGASRTIDVRFSPTTAGPASGTLSLVSGGVTRTIALTGRGVAATLSFSFTIGADRTPLAPGGSAGFPSTVIGSSNTADFTITNSGTVPAAVGRIALANPNFAAAGVPPLPATLPPGGSLSFRIAFAPDVPGSDTATLNVDDRSFTLSGVGLIAAASISGASGNVQPATQPTVGVRLSRSYARAITGTLRLGFQSSAGGEDRMVQFLGGLPPLGRTVNFTIPAGATEALFGASNQVPFQSGTVAGAITFDAVFDVGGTDVSPPSRPTSAVAIPRAAPVIRPGSLTVTRNAAGWVASMVFFATGRSITSFNATLTAASGVVLQITGLPLNVTPQSTSWYGSAESNAFGSLATFSVTFTGDPAAVARMSATITGPDGTSPAVEAAVAP